MSEPITNTEEAVRELGALPVPVGTKPPLQVITEEQVEALVAAGNKVVNDRVHLDLCGCDAWPEKCASTDLYFPGAWDVDGLEDALPAVLALWEELRGGGEAGLLRARVAELEAAATTNYRAEHPDSGIVLGTYSRSEAARQHCEDLERRSWVTGTTLAFDWIEDDGVAELVVTAGQNEESVTGYVVTEIEVASEYDAEADE